MDHHIKPGQIYRSLDPRGGPRVRIRSFTAGHAHAWVEDAATGKRARWVLVAALHATATTKSGTPRRTGYALEQPDAR